MINKLNIDKKTVKSCRKSAHKIAAKVQKYIDIHSTVAVERTVCRLFGIDSIDDVDVPLPNVVIEALVENDLLENGASDFFARVFLHTGLSPQEVAVEISEYRFDFDNLPDFSLQKKVSSLERYTVTALERIKKQRKRRNLYLEEYGDKDGPLLYVIVATGDIREDVTQAIAAASQGADVIAVIRTTGQSLLDYVPYGETHEGFGGTYATQENFSIMRSALDKISKQQKRYIRLVNYASGLCMPEIAVCAAFEDLDILLNDSMYGILFRDINMKRTFIDQHFSRLICTRADMMINTGEDNYLTTSDAVEKAQDYTWNSLKNGQQLGSYQYHPQRFYWK